MMTTDNTTLQNPDYNVATAEKRKFYAKPRLEEIGDLRTITLGVSGGPGESGELDEMYMNF